MLEKEIKLLYKVQFNKSGMILLIKITLPETGNETSFSLIPVVKVKSTKKLSHSFFASIPDRDITIRIRSM